MRLRADSSSPEIVTYSRAWRGTTYVFALNDKRTFGDYVGQWGLTMEKGLPFAGEVTLADPEEKIGAVYELSRGGEVKFARRDDGRNKLRPSRLGDVVVPVSYDTNDGRLLLFLPRKIASVDAEVAKAGDALSVTMTVRDAAGEPVQALLPVEIRVYDAAGPRLRRGGPRAGRRGLRLREGRRVQTHGAHEPQRRARRVPRRLPRPRERPHLRALARMIAPVSDGGQRTSHPRA